MAVKVRVRRWLEDDEFEEILKISDYLGREPGKGSLFLLNVEKALSNGYSFEDVMGLVKELGGELEGSLEELRKEFSARRRPLQVSWDRAKGLVVIALTPEHARSLARILEAYGARRVARGEGEVKFSVNPNVARDLLVEIRRRGFEVEDPEKLFEDKPLPVRPTIKGVELRPYQKEALSSWLSNGGKGIIALPTGSGKTLVAIAAMAEASQRTLIIAFTKEQVLQWRDFILRYTDFPGSYVGTIYSEEKRLAPITITTYHSGYRLINELSPHFNLLIVDEVHHLPADKFRHIAVHSIATYRMGLSATPTREDGRHRELFPLLGGIVYFRSFDDLASQGYLAKYVVKTLRVRPTPEEYENYRKYIEEFRRHANALKLEEVVERAKRGDANAIAALTALNRARAVLARSETKIRKAIELAREELDKGNKIIIFTQFVDQAKAIAEGLNAYLLTGETPAQERKRILEEFRASKSGVLVVTTVGDEGLDIPDANVGILVSGTSSRRQFVQRLGRLLRPKDNGKEALLYEIVLAKTSEEYQARRRKQLDLDELLAGEEREDVE